MLKAQNSPPKMCYFGLWIILKWRQLRHRGLARNSPLRVFKFGAWSIMRVITRNNFLIPTYKAEQTLNYFTSTLLSHEWTYSPLSPEALDLILSSRCHIYLILTLLPWTSQVCGVNYTCTYVIKFSYFLLLICLMLIWLLDHLKETWGCRKISSSSS